MINAELVGEPDAAGTALSGAVRVRAVLPDEGALLDDHEKRVRSPPRRPMN